MKILVVGGSYFLGKAFVEMAAKLHEVHVVNRGSRPLQKPDVREYFLDRHDGKALAAIEETRFDVIVDFCAYQKGDIRFLTEHLGASFEQYIFISTCDVYRRGTGTKIGEDSALEDRDFGGEAGAYIIGKAALESELRECCQRREAAYTSIRPAFIYGPDNYAPREGIYFKWLTSAGQIIHPADATGEFQMVYVRDVARAVLAACGHPDARDKAYNLCNGESMTYDSFATLLREATGTDFEKVKVSVRDVIEKGIPLPFPLTDEESEHYDGERVTELGVTYTPIGEGMAETFRAYLKIQEE
ncbi:MAG: NAD-dependent epimerase/dehydratase family protein [Candidatus Gastranaerophilales bacterium]|nr:NAD-dependent epimerase/dehydratase family protein [Candidatus Gastranaerophilales bacterium]